MDLETLGYWATRFTGRRMAPIRWRVVTVDGRRADIQTPPLLRYPRYFGCGTIRM
jgi:hypothetical protein